MPNFIIIHLRAHRKGVKILDLKIFTFFILFILSSCGVLTVAGTYMKQITKFVSFHICREFHWLSVKHFSHFID